MTTLRNISKFFLLSALLALIVIIGSGCKAPETEAYKNKKPIARLSNIPPTDSVKSSGNPRITLSWVGDDPDGYIVGFRYRWSYTVGSTVVGGRPVGGQVFHHSWNTILNITVKNLALMLDTTNQSPSSVFAAYHFFATLPPEGLDNERTELLAAGDTIVVEGVRVFASNPDVIRYPVHVNPNSGTFIFDSQDSLNLHTFEVSAIDDSAAIGDPAIVTFVTPKVSAPTTEITSGPIISDTSLVIDHITDTFDGIQFTFLATDPNSRTLEYSWTVDSTSYVAARDSQKYFNVNGIRWTKWNQSGVARVTAEEFDPAKKYQVRHTFAVRSRNEFGSVDTVGSFIRGGTTIQARTVFYAQYPEWQKPGGLRRILVINKSFAWDTTGQAETVHGWRPTIALMENFYKDLFSRMGRTNYDLKTYTRDTIPTRGLLGKYSTVVLVCDAIDRNGKYARETAVGGRMQTFLHDYVSVGGSFITTGWNLNSIVNVGQAASIFPTIIHAQPADLFNLNINTKRIHANRDSVCSILSQSIESYELGGATATVAGYPQLEIDTARLDTAFYWHNTGGTWNPQPPNKGLGKIWLMNPSGFGEYLYAYRSQNGQTCWDGLNIGVRYQGVTFNSIYFGFPLYHMKSAQAAQALNKALSDCGE